MRPTDNASQQPPQSAPVAVAHGPSLDSDAMDTFTKRITTWLTKNLSSTALMGYQSLSYEPLYQLFCELIWHHIDDHPFIGGVQYSSVPDWDELYKLYGLYELRELRKLYGQLKYHQEDLKTIFAEYQPNMVSVSDLDRAIASLSLAAQTTKTPAQTPGLKFYILGPKVDVYELAGYSALKGAIVQAASQTNCLELRSPRNLIDPFYLSGDETQGPAVQKGCPALALARYRYWKLHEREDSFLRNWKNQTIVVEGRTVNFKEIFETQNGYMHPIRGMEQAALDFILAHKDKLLINIEFTEYTKAQHAITQVLNTAMALGDYDGSNFSWVERTQRRKRNEEPLKSVCAEFLKIQYEMIAKLAVLEAKKHPNCRIPLVLTLVGGGAFANSYDAISAAIKTAIDEVKKSGVANIDFAISAHSDNDQDVVLANRVLAGHEVASLMTKEFQSFESAQTLLEVGSKKGFDAIPLWLAQDMPTALPGKYAVTAYKYYGSSFVFTVLMQEQLHQEEVIVVTKRVMVTNGGTVFILSQGGGTYEPITDTSQVTAFIALRNKIIAQNPNAKDGYTKYLDTPVLISAAPPSSTSVVSTAAAAPAATLQSPAVAQATPPTVATQGIFSERKVMMSVGVGEERLQLEARVCRPHQNVGKT